MTTPEEFRASFERRGKSNVRAFIEAGKSRGGVLDDGTLEAIRWLDEVETAEALAASSKRDAREEATLAIAKEANDIARSQTAAAWRASRYAMYAAIIATTAALVASKEEILVHIFGNP